MKGLKGWHVGALALAWVWWEHDKAQRALAGVAKGAKLAGGAALSDVPKGSKDATGDGGAGIVATPGIVGSRGPYTVSIEDGFRSKQQGMDGGNVWAGGMRPEYLL